jgi:Flp pilus assembly protein TadG
MKVTRSFRAFRSSESGAIAVLFAISLLPMLVAAGIAIDYVRAQTARVVLQSAIDAAALAAGAEANTNSAEIEALATHYLNANVQNLEFENTNFTVTDQQDASGRKNIQISASAELKTVFLTLFDADKITISTTTDVQRIDAGPVHIALVLDVTGSMNALPSTGGTKSKIAVLKEAALDLVDEVMDDAGPDTMIGVVPYAGNVRAFPSASLPSPVPDWILPLSRSGNVCTQWSAYPPGCIVTPSGCFIDGVWNPTGCYTYTNCTRTCLQTTTVTSHWGGCIGPRARDLNGTTITTAYLETIDNPTAPRYPGVPADTFQCSNSPILPLSGSKSAIESTINGLSTTGDTYIPGGLTWGWNVLDDREPYPTMPRAAFQALGGRKVVVLMTDGLNSLGVRSSDGYLVTGSYVPSVVNGRTSSLCQKIKNDGIEIFTVLFDVQNAATETMLRDCASSPSMAFVADNSDELVQAFRNVASMLSPLRLNK